LFNSKSETRVEVDFDEILSKTEGIFNDLKYDDFPGKNNFV
jgi:hypothetical protein